VKGDLADLASEVEMLRRLPLKVVPTWSNVMSQIQHLIPSHLIKSISAMLVNGQTDVEMLFKAHAGLLFQLWGKLS
jgi:hypothetical protein